MSASNKSARLVLVSPWTLTVFLVIPGLVVLSQTQHLPIPVVASPRTLFLNNFLFAAVIVCRFLRYTLVLRRPVRYDAGRGRPEQGDACAAPASQLRQTLAADGYRFAADGAYGEQRDAGYLGTTLCYGGLLLVLAVGIWNNLSQFSGTVLDGMGPTTLLSRPESYRSVVKGPLAPSLDGMPRLQIVDQIFPNSTYPKGATVISLLAEDGSVRNETLRPGTPIRYGDYDISMTRLVFDPQIVITDRRASKVLFDAVVRLEPLVEKRGNFSFYGAYTGIDLVGGVYYQPEKSLLKVVITRNGRREVADMTFQVNQQATTADYLLSCARMGQWSELRVVRHRNMTGMAAGGALALLGLVLRLAIRPRRVWLEETPEGCQVYATDPALGKKLPATA